MNKRHSLLLIFLLLFITKINAQFVGYYNMHDGGVDMPHSSLFVLPNNEFMFFYYGGYKAGIWKEIDKNNISLIETKSNNNPTKIISRGDEKSTEIMIDVEGLVKAHAHINFSKDTISEKEFQPVFNEWTDCIDNHYIIKKKSGEYNWLTIALPTNPNFGRQSIKYPYKAKTYTFSLSKIQGSYFIHYDEDALNEKMEFKLTKSNENYTFDYSDKKLEREDLTNDLNEQISNAKKQISKAKLMEEMRTPLPLVSISNTIIYKPNFNPIFTAKCKEDEKSTEPIGLDKPMMPTVDRLNGFYTVVNFKENEYHILKYKLAKEPSITKEDILSVNKIVSDNGGYEVEIIFTEIGSLKFAQLSKKNIRKPIVIVANNFFVSAPVFASEINGGKMIIAGDFSDTEIDALIANLKK